MRACSMIGALFRHINNSSRGFAPSPWIWHYCLQAGLEGTLVGKLLSPKLALWLACFLVIECQTVHAPTQSKPTAQSPAQPQAQSQGLTPTQSQTQPQAQLQARPRSPGLTAVANATARRAAETGSAISVQVKRLIGSGSNTLGKIRAKLFREDFQLTELSAIILAGVILVGGAFWILASRRLARRGR